MIHLVSVPLERRYAEKTISASGSLFIVDAENQQIAHSAHFATSGSACQYLTLEICAILMKHAVDRHYAYTEILL